MNNKKTITHVFVNRSPINIEEWYVQCDVNSHLGGESTIDRAERMGSKLGHTC